MKRIRQAWGQIVLLVCLSLCGGWSPAAAQASSAPGFVVRPSEVTVPDGAELGLYRRTIQPFPNWELRCDENLKTRKKICNITQTIQDREGRFAFGWSLAATEEGKPLMILRTRPELGLNKPVTLVFPDRKQPVTGQTHACDSRVCVAFLPVGPIMREEIAKAATVRLSYEPAASEPLVFDAPLQGLAAALAAIK
ncbi:MAG: invasion associated locus B family protein [Phyllobacterium sp.]